MNSVSFATRDFICWDPQRELVRLISNGVESRLSVEVRQKHDSWLPHFLFQSIAFPTNQLEDFSTECLRTKTKTIITANHSKGKYHQEPVRPRIKKKGKKRGKTRVTKLRLILALNVIGRVSGASFLNQSHKGIRQNQIKPELLPTLNWKLRHQK